MTELRVTQGLTKSAPQALPSVAFVQAQGKAQEEKKSLQETLTTALKDKKREDVAKTLGAEPYSYKPAGKNSVTGSENWAKFDKDNKVTVMVQVQYENDVFRRVIVREKAAPAPSPSPTPSPKN